MGQFKFTECDIEGMFLVEPAVFGDNRGYFMETYNENDSKDAGYDLTFVQDNQSSSSKGVLRGLHLQLKYPQGKLVRVLKGEVFDVGVDLRADSPTYGKWFGAILSDENKKQLYIPPCFAHGFVVLSDAAQFQYKVDNPYAPQSEATLRFDEPALGIDWRIAPDEMLLSEKDLKGMISICSKIRKSFFPAFSRPARLP